jgi:hypothetical protein
MYYEKLIKDLHEKNTLDTCLSSIINPFSLYYLCNHYYGDEFRGYNIPISNDKNDLFKNKDLSKLKEGDIIHCQVNYFSDFCNEILDKIETKIILTTGQWHRPQLQKSELTEKVLRHKNIILWVSQNPIYDNSDKYMAFPYGIVHCNIKEYADVLLNTRLPKNKELLYLSINNNTNSCRYRLPVIPCTPPLEYYKNISEGKFIISPIGDRDDCYRHYEAIGLGTIPISNVSCFYKNIFTTNMVYATIDEMVNMLNKDSINLNYVEPNKDLICFEYYKNIIQSKIKSILTPSVFF